MKKSLTKEQALKKMQNICSKNEKCVFDIENKLYKLGISKADINEIIGSLKQDGFIDDIRYAEIYVKEKFYLNKWGKIKLKFMLMQKNINESVVNNELEKIPDDEYVKTLESLLEKKYKTFKSADVTTKRRKLLAFANSRGFESGKVFDIVKKVIDNKEK